MSTQGDTHTLSTKEKKSIARAGRLHWMHWFIVGLSLLLTLSAWQFSRAQLYEKNKNQFEYESAQVIEQIIERMQKYEDALWGGVAAIHSQSHGMDYAEWKRFADTLKIDKKYPGINGIGVIKRLSLNDAEAYVAQEREARPNFKIHPKHNAPELMPIVYIEPIDVNLAALGLDMAHEKNRYTAAKKSRDTGDAQITAPITLVQDSQKTPGFLFFAPYYSGNDNTIEARRENFEGLVYAPFIMHKLMDGTLAQDKRRVSVNIKDGTDVLYSDAKSANLDTSNTYKEKYIKSVEYNMYGRPWVIDIKSTPMFTAATSSSKPIMILLAGLIIDTLLLCLFIALVRANRKAINLAHKMERQASLVLDNAGEGICGIDESGNIIFINNAVTDILGYTQGEMIDKSFKTLIHTSNQGDISHNTDKYMVDATLQDGQMHAQNDDVFWHKDGKSIPVSYTSSPMKDGAGNMSGAVIVFRDITSRKDYEEFKNLITETIPDLVFVKNKDFKIVEANSAFLSLYPADKRDGVIGTTTLEDYDPQEREAFLALDKKAFEEGVSEVEESVRFPNGDRRTLNTKKVRFYDRKGEPFILGVSHDITPMKKMQEQQEVLIERLTQSNVELERFAYVASHDLQEPLRMVVSFTERLKLKYEDQLDEKAQQYIGFAYDGAVRMQQLIRDLLEYSSIAQDMNSYIEVDCNESMKVVMQNLSVTIEETDADIKCDTLPKLIWQPTRFTSLMQNIIGNALKYKADDRAPVIAVKVADEETHWLFSVSDNGIGIKSEYAEQIFETFRRLHTKNKYAGTGIGLSICKKIVTSRGGKIWIESQEDVGTTFFFTVPKKFDEDIVD